MKQACVWCGRPFTATAVSDKTYRLEQAGTRICLACSDLWEDMEITLHNDKLRCFLDKAEVSVHTLSGHVLPMNLSNWHRTLLGSMKAEAVDWFGRRWIAKRSFGDKITLKPIGGTR
jgi:hypothetical protein